MNQKSCVYSIINLTNNKRYIGSAKDIDRRVYSHTRLLRMNKHHCIYLQRAWNKYGESNFIFHIIEWCSIDRMRGLEQVYLDSLKPDYNTSLSSTAPMDGRKHSGKTIAIFQGRKTWNKGIPRTTEEKALMSFRSKEVIASRPPEFWAASSERARKYTEEHGSPFQGRHHTDENKKALRNLRKSKKRIICINTSEIFDAQIDIQRKYGFKQGHVSEVLNGKRQDVKGIKFKYEGEEPPKYKSHLVPVRDNLGNTFRTITDCCKFHNLNRSQVLNSFRGGQESTVDGITITRINVNA